jgi:ethanolamine ammonia-lyase small subunit
VSGVSRWTDLRRFTAARVALGRVGNGLPTAAHLDFQEAHARARDAVWSELDTAALAEAVRPLGLATRVVASQAPDRRTYLLRPDLGRRLRAEDRDALAAEAMPGALSIVVADGLCASGVGAGAPALLEALVPMLRAAGWRIAPLTLATGARVALGDEVGEALGAAAVVVVIGERPGLGALDSIGIYLTWAPRRGRSDAERNCISNVRPGGLGVAEAARKTAWLLDAARTVGLTGVALKDEEPAALPGAAAPQLSRAP